MSSTTVAAKTGVIDHNSLQLPVTQCTLSKNVPVHVDQFITHLKQSVKDRPLTGYTDRRLKAITSNYRHDISKILEQFPKSAPVVLYIAFLCSETDLAQAEALFRRVLELDKENVTASIFLAQILLMKSTCESYLEVAKLIDVVSYGPNQEKSVLETLRGYYHFEQKKDFRNAHFAYLDANNFAPSKLAYFRLGRIFEAEYKDEPMAIEYYSSAIVCDTTFVEAHLALASLYATQGKFMLAKNALDEARLHHEQRKTKMNGDYKPAWNEMDKQLKQLGEKIKKSIPAPQ